MATAPTMFTFTPTIPTTTTTATTATAPNKSIKACLTCISDLTEYKSNEKAQNEWQTCLANIDSAIGQIYDEIIQDELESIPEFIVISTPFRLQDIHRTIEHSISEQLPSNCFEVITEFMFPSKNWISKILSKSSSAFSKVNNLHNNDNNNNNDIIDNLPIDQWTSDKHDGLLKSEAIIIIDTETGKFQTVPRYIMGLLPDYNSNNKQRNWSLTWNRTPSQEKYTYTQIYSIIGHHIGCISFPDYFHLSGDWSLKTDFSDVEQCGYLCDSGEIAFGDVCKQNSWTSKIFITYADKSQIRGKKYEWLTVPNYRLCGPSLDDIYKKNKKKTSTPNTTRPRSNSAYRDLSTFYCSAPGTKPRRSRYDMELERAIAASLGKEYNSGSVEERGRSRRNHNDEEDLQRAMAASLGQQYVAGQKFGSDDYMDTDNVQQRENHNNNNNNNNTHNYRDREWNMNASSTDYDEQLKRAIAASLKEMEVDNDGTNQTEKANENENENGDDDNDHDVVDVVDIDKEDNNENDRRDDDNDDVVVDVVDIDKDNNNENDRRENEDHVVEDRRNDTDNNNNNNNNGDTTMSNNNNMSVIMVNNNMTVDNGNSDNDNDEREDEDQVIEDDRNDNGNNNNNNEDTTMSNMNNGSAMMMNNNITGNNYNSNNNYVNWANEDEEIQRAIAESLRYQ